uniref:CCHC-type domain-containing protein n=1 Tax=Chelonoidis abingdonii TaxID=106734 RepID=A0A8C0GYG2_CHEAB
MPPAPGPGALLYQVISKFMLYRVLRSLSARLAERSSLWDGWSGPWNVEQSKAEEFELWLEHTTEMLQEWAILNAEKRRCLIENLSGPALDMICTLKLIEPGISVKDCLEALHQTFGSVEGPEDSYCKFLNSRQQRGEKISAYIQRLEGLLQQAVMRGAVTAEQMDQTRLAQVLRGTQYQNPILLHLWLRERQENPPSNSQLIKEVREEKERQAASECWEAQTLEPTSTTPLQMVSVLLVSTTEELAQQMQVLTEQIAELQSTIDRAKISRNKKPQTVAMEKSAFRATIPPRGRWKGQFFCYLCGQDGHSAAKCHNEENPSLVYGKLRISWERSSSCQRVWGRRPPRPAGFEDSPRKDLDTTRSLWEKKIRRRQPSSSLKGFISSNTCSKGFLEHLSHSTSYGESCGRHEFTASVSLFG